jgi:NADH-quinone oxidoreductase subunit G
MSASAKPDLITVNIDGRDVHVPKGTNIIEAASKIGVEVPHYCYHPKLSVVGNCRMCLVEMGMPALDPATRTPLTDPATGKPSINWIPRPQIGCATYASPGMHIRTSTPLIKECREGVMEFLLINHPLDCPICDQAGECSLQEFATGYGRGYSRFVEQKVVKPKRTQLGPRVTLDDERCILCSRCIRFCKEVPKDDVLGFIDRGSYSTLTCYPGKKLENNYSLNTVDICPVGALTSTDFRFKMRVWFLKTTPSICAESSAGTNTEVWSREGVIYRITPRRNDAVNDTWMTDSGRELYKQVESPDRLRDASINGITATLEAALKTAADLISASFNSDNRKSEIEDRKSAVAIVASGRSSVEEQFLTRRLAEATNASTSLVSRNGAGDGLLLTADRNPNIRGALVTGLIDAMPSAKLESLAASIDSGAVKTIVSIGEDLAAAGLTEEQLARVSIVYLGTHANATSKAANVVIPTLTVFEKSGSFVNQQFRLQKFHKAVPGPAGAIDDLAAIASLVKGITGTTQPATVEEVWSALAAEVAILSAQKWSTIPPDGVQLEAGSFASLPFCEGESLHYKPAKEAVTA